MADQDFLSELAKSAGVPRSNAESVLDALGRLAPGPAPWAGPWPAASAHAAGATSPPGGSAAVEALIAAASCHPLGLDFLRDGDLAAVAITFQTHAFTVEAARQRLGAGGTPT